MRVLAMLAGLLKGAGAMLLEIVAVTIGGALGMVVMIVVGLIKLCAAIAAGLGLIGMVFWGAAWLLMKKDLAALQTPLIFAAMWLGGMAVFATLQLIGRKLSDARAA